MSIAAAQRSSRDDLIAALLWRTRARQNLLPATTKQISTRSLAEQDDGVTWTLFPAGSALHAIQRGNNREAMFFGLR
jgi:hypothetical protein